MESEPSPQGSARSDGSDGSDGSAMSIDSTSSMNSLASALSNTSIKDRVPPSDVLRRSALGAANAATPGGPGPGGNTMSTMSMLHVDLESISSISSIHTSAVHGEEVETALEDHLVVLDSDNNFHSEMIAGSGLLTPAYLMISREDGSWAIVNVDGDTIVLDLRLALSSPTKYLYDAATELEYAISFDNSDDLCGKLLVYSICNVLCTTSNSKNKI